MKIAGQVIKSLEDTLLRELAASKAPRGKTQELEGPRWGPQRGAAAAGGPLCPHWRIATQTKTLL